MSMKLSNLLGAVVISAFVGATFAQAKSIAPAKQSSKIQKERIRRAWPAGGSFRDDRDGAA